MKLSREKIVQQAARAGRRTLQLGEEAGGRIRRRNRMTPDKEGKPMLKRILSVLLCAALLFFRADLIEPFHVIK